MSSLQGKPVHYRKYEADLILAGTRLDPLEPSRNRLLSIYPPQLTGLAFLPGILSSDFPALPLASWYLDGSSELCRFDLTGLLWPHTEWYSGHMPALASSSSCFVYFYHRNVSPTNSTNRQHHKPSSQPKTKLSRYLQMDKVSDQRPLSMTTTQPNNPCYALFFHRSLENQLQWCSSCVCFSHLTALPLV